MTYNLHPIFVHFPIAFFLLYSLLRLIPWPKKLLIVDWQIPRIFILVVGLLGAGLANATGDIAKHLSRPNNQLVEMHETFAGISVNIYVILLIAELIVFIKPEWLEINYLKTIKPLFIFLKKITGKWLFYLLAVIGALAIAITGLLGGVMVYGVKADPLAAPILKLLGL
jgi:uncharacterized membrane protein